MRRILITVLLLLALLPLVQGQDAPKPLYSVAISTYGPTYVTTFYSDETERTVEVPFMFQQYDVAHIAPVWQDGRLWGIVPQIGKDSYDMELGWGGILNSYDPLTETTGQPINILPEPIYEALRINSIAPDGSHAWLTRSANFHLPSILVDLQSGEFYETECVAAVVGWTADQVVVGSTAVGGNPCPPQVYALDLATQTRVKTVDLPVEGDAWDAYADGGYVLDDGRWLIGPRYPYYAATPVGILGDAQGDLYYGRGMSLQLAPDQQLASFVTPEPYELVIIDLSSGEEIFRTPDVPSVYRGHTPTWEGDSLTFWQVTADEIRRNQWQAGTVTSEVIYTGTVPETYHLSPTDDVVLLQLPDRVEIHTPAQVWQSGTNFPDEITLAGYAARLKWSGDWVHLDTPEQGSLSFNVQTGESIAAPITGATVVSSSPDGAWWLYAHIDMENDSDTLVALHAESGTQLTLLEDVALGQRNFHFGPGEYYVWSGLLE